MEIWAFERYEFSDLAHCLAVVVEVEFCELSLYKDRVFSSKDEVN